MIALTLNTELALGYAKAGQWAECIIALTNGTHVVECWRLTPDELAEVAKTGCVWLAMVGGVPPILVGSKATIRYFVADQGVWRDDGGKDKK